MFNFLFPSKSKKAQEVQVQQPRDDDDDCCEQVQNIDSANYSGQQTGISQTGNDKGDQKILYEFSSAVVKDRLGDEDPENIKLLAEIDDKSVIVVSGSADKIETVFSAIKMPHKLVSPEAFMNINLVAEQTVYINCHTTAYPSGIHDKIRNFVNSGGQLITTDWSLNTILQQAFPGFVKWDNKSTADQIVNITMNAEDKDEILQGFKNEKVWWLAGGSHPITVADPHKVAVLITSAELEKLFPGCGSVLVRFEYGKGVIYHMISHFHLQHSSTRPARPSSVPQSATSTDYYVGKGAKLDTMAQKAVYEEEYGREWNYDEVQNATTQSEFCMRTVIKQKKKSK